MKAIVSLACALALALVACGGATIDPLEDGGTDGQQADAPPETSGPWPCGTTSCGSGDMCIHPCCGGAAPICAEPDDAGVCPPGYTENGFCEPINGGSGHCAPPACQPPPPYCAPANNAGGCSPYNNASSRDCYEVCA